MVKQLKIGILATGITPDELLEKHGSYADMFVALFDQVTTDFEYQVFDVREDLFPDDAMQCDAWVITGSKFNVYQNTPWMLRLKSLILEISVTGRPMVGICFGHQIIADAFGGVVDKHPDGWGVGLHAYQLTAGADFIQGAPESFAISAMHQDQVLALPKNAKVFAESEFCPYAGLIYDDQILTFQAHPEFNLEYEDELIDLRKGDVIPLDVCEVGLTQVREKGAATDSVMIAHWMADFLRLRVG
ncbi:glutamine amidotransferase, class I [Marinomonas sp. MED121]|uniref:glutamine amidotransferase-related protein n=1 Tax=Marinomonas sp. MED121 TaxID=314277 RepID=UPI0000690D1D|nr:glutamine amidotransferase [Marinomonas sp. MED121]EAQ65306.1 glutamine amidotransferase, class I [Marinomonas sp. MED121]